MIKNRKVFILMAILLVITVVVVGVVIFLDNKYQDIYIYETNDEIIGLFESNIEDFNEYVDKFKTHIMWDSYYENKGDSDFVNYKGFKEYTTDEEYAFLNLFYGKYHPAFWGRSSLGFYVKSGHVRLIKDDDLTAHTQLEIEKAQNSDAVIKYYDYGWICIAYPGN